jgi:hypothetical protein
LHGLLSSQLTALQQALKQHASSSSSAPRIDLTTGVAWQAWVAAMLESAAALHTDSPLPGAHDLPGLMKYMNRVRACCEDEGEALQAAVPDAVTD